MAFPTITEKLGSLSATGLAKEATFGTPVTPSTFLPMTSNTMEEEPGWFSPELMMGLRDLHVFNLQGEAKFNGAIAGPIFPSNAMELVSSSVGQDATASYGVIGTFATLTTTTTSGTISAGATTFTVTSGTGFAVNQQVTVDTGSFQEVRKITNVVTNTITVADAFAFAHASGVTVTTYAPTTTSSGSTIAGATTITVTSAAGLAQNEIIQIDVNSVSGVTTSECRKITNITTNTLTLDVALTYPHASGVNVSLVNTTGPFTHTFVEGASTIPSLTVEKNLGNFQSLQFAGCRVNKFDLKMPVGNTAAEMTADLMGRSVAVLDTPSAISVTNEIPFVFTEASLNFYNTLRAETHNVNLVIENGVKETYTYSGQHGPSFLTPVTLHVNGSVDVVWDSLDDAIYGDFNRMANQTLGALGFQLQHPSLSSTINFVCPQIALSKYANDVKMTDPIMSTMSFEASRMLSGGAQYTIQATISNQVYLPY